MGKKGHHVRGNSDGIPNLSNIIPEESFHLNPNVKIKLGHKRVLSGSSGSGYQKGGYHGSKNSGESEGNVSNGGGVAPIAQCPYGGNNQLENKSQSMWNTFESEANNSR